MNNSNAPEFISCKIDKSVTFGKNVKIYPGNIVQGNTHLGNDVVLMPNNYICDCTIGDNSIIEYSYLKQSKVGKNVKIGHNCVLDGDIELGDNTIIYNNVSIINKVIIGKDCVIQSGALIGQDDFSYTENEDHKKNMIKHYGGVQIEDDVLIGPGTIINRGTIDNTIISKGCKIDARCVVSHNVVLGENIVLIAGSILYGSVKTGMNAYVASAMVRNQLRIGDNAVIGMGSVVVKDVDADVTVTGVPAKKFVK